MRSKGGFILIKVDKDLSDITADDFDKEIFKTILRNKVRKPLMFETKDNCLMLDCSVTDTLVVYTFTRNYFAEDATPIQIESIEINYNSVIDIISYARTYFEF